MHVALVFLAMLMGIASTAQGASNGTLANRIGLPSALLVNAAIVAGGALVAWLVTRRGFTSEPPSPWFLYIGGAYGLFIIAGVAYSFPKLGAGPTTAVMVAAQLSAALLLDHLGLPKEKIAVTPWRMLGVAFLFTGALLVLWPKLR